MYSDCFMPIAIENSNPLSEVTGNILFSISGLIFLMLINTPALASKSVNYIYINASEGNASGGHVAIRFDDNIYHYQYVDPGLIKLDKQTVNDFEFNYRFLENRSLYLSQLTMSDQTYHKLRDHFDYRFQIQKQHYAVPTELNREKMLLQYFSGQSISHPKLLQIPAAEWFYSKRDFNDDFSKMPFTSISANKNKASSILTNINQKIKTQYGERYIEKRLQTLTKQIKQIKPTAWTEQSTQLKTEQLSAITYTFANRYLDSITAWLALKVIQQQRPLQANVYHTSGAAEFTLSTGQKTAMKKFSAVLQDNILSLLQSSRPDWGSALLSNLARLFVLEKSIQQQRLVILKNPDTTNVAENITQPELRFLYRETIKNFQQVKQQFETQTQHQEISYSQLEWQASRFLALDKMIIQSSVKNVPSNKPLHLPKFLIPLLTNKQLESSLKSLEKVNSHYQKELDNLYRYSLLQRNCVTELFMTIDQAVSYQETRKNTEIQANKKVQLQYPQPLDGDISKSLSKIIPFMSYQAVNDQYRGNEQRTLSSYRLQQMQKLYSKENKLAVFLRESNTLSSSFYKANASDSFFIFFTDEHPLLRPFYGIVNTLAGLSQSFLGLFSFPFDSGQYLQSGIKGIMMSLPELIFFNMRKGTFKHLPYNKLLTADETIIRRTKPSDNIHAF